MAGAKEFPAPASRDGFRTEEECLKAVQTDPAALDGVPQRLRTPEVCMAAVRQDGTLLELVPWKHRTLGLCRAAMLAGGDDAVFHVPERFRTPELCLLSCEPSRWSADWAAARRTAEALPRRFFGAGGILKPEMAAFFGRTHEGREMLERLRAPDGSFRRLARRLWSEDEEMEAPEEGAELCGFAPGRRGG